MKQVALAALIALFAANAHAASCKVEAANKKLAGAELKSFMTKCKADVRAACNKAADDQKLSGAAKTDFVKKCVKDPSKK